MDPLPAPVWFVQLFKVLGFALHMVPMHLWYAGLVVAFGLYVFSGEHGRRFGRRLVRQMPIILALGINFGIVPLLFLQLAYPKAFYTATILMAWFWLAIVGLLIPAYYGVYLCGHGLREGGAGMRLLRQASGWGAAGLFVLIGFLFANGLSLMTNVGAWRDLWSRHSLAGAATGTALNLGDPTLWPRWLLMFGLALGTTAAWAVVDAAWLAARESEPYKRWVRDLAFRLAVVGALWATLAGSWYVFGTWRAEVRGRMFVFPMILLTLATAGSAWFGAGLMWLGRGRPLDRALAAAIGGAQFAAILLNAVGRQVVQNMELQLARNLEPEKRLYPVVQPQVAADWGPLAMFLATLLAGAVVVGWMLFQVGKARSQPAS